MGAPSCLLLLILPSACTPKTEPPWKAITMAHRGGPVAMNGGCAAAGVDVDFPSISPPLNYGHAITCLFLKDYVNTCKNGMRSLRGKSKEYKQNYEYVFEHQSEIVAMYYQSEQEELVNNVKGTLNAFRDAVAEVDPRVFDMIAADAAVNYGDNFLDGGISQSGTYPYREHKKTPGFLTRSGALHIR